ncbi:hypothetical protein tinsulaeT_37350 [Thalassotalea insulae]|uniref:Tetratricopeptide repeat protein n=1 Tax=Thalassotalea insulae TaxID=2056778 RepID=A0ABQ6H0W5_9GAMM|nr:tetratricopeptide repeat protein [Thalassotalea insulae]GLX80395.1 hypothetical protein tinsulaeT_37350 [Thalassotalea insulae]
MFALDFNARVRLPILMLILLVVSCQTTTSNEKVSVNTTLYIDEAFPKYQTFDIETEQDIFAIDQEMKEMVKEKLLVVRDSKKRAQELLKQLFKKDSINLSYQNLANLTAIDAYHSGTANCMSLTIMAYALAKEAQLDVKFQKIQVPEYWTRNGQYNMLTGHVNLLLTERPNPEQMIIYGKKLIQIDFDPSLFKNAFPKTIIGKPMVLAMFYNNKGADAIVAEQYDLAYAYFKKSTQVAPQFSSAWGNLGILYKVTENYNLAKQAYRYAVELDNRNLTALGNLAFLLKSQGQIAQADKIERLLHSKRIKNPYYYALLADEAFYQGDYHQALMHYKKALKMNYRVHEFHFGLAKVYYALNDIDKAENAMEKAISYSKSENIDSQYIAKLNFLKHVSISD